MKLDEIKKKVDQIYYYADFNKGYIKLDWHNCIESPKFPLIASDPYKALCNKFKLTRLHDDFTRYEQEGDTVMAYPELLIYGRFTFISAYTKERNLVKEAHLHCSNGESCGMIVLYDGELMKIDKTKVPYYYSHDTLDPDLFIGMWGDNVVYVSSDGIYMLSPEGAVSFIGAYPADSASGRVEAILSGDTVTVEEYVYYDCDHHHGGWEEASYDLKKVA